MGRHKAILLAITMLTGGIVSAGPAETQTFRTYCCADGTQFIVGFYDDDKRAFLQIDGEPVTLAKRLAVSGIRYSGADHACDRQEWGHDGQASEAAGDVLRGGLNGALPQESKRAETSLFRPFFKLHRPLERARLYQTSRRHQRSHFGLASSTAS